MRDVNLETITCTLSWYKILPLDGLNLILCTTKSAHETEKSLLKILGTGASTKSCVSDNSMEFGRACEVLSWNHCTSTPHRSETNGIAERAVRRVKEGTSAVLLRSSIDERWWSDLLAYRKTPYERRFGIPFKGPMIPFGAMVEYHPSSPKDQMRIHHFGKKSF